MKNFLYFVTISTIVFHSTLNAQWVQTDVPSGGRAFTVTISGTSLFAVSYVDQVGHYFFVSTDRGATWTPTGDDFANERGPTALTGNGTIIFAGYFFSHGLFLSTNNGTEWTPVNSFPSPHWITALAINGVNVLVGTMSGGVHLSTDNGTNWTSSILDESVSISSFIISETNIFSGTYGAGIFLSTDNGEHWTTVNNGLTDTYVNSLVASGTNIFAGTKSGVYLSTDNGRNWTLVNNGLTDTNVYSLVASETNIFAGTDGDGVYLSTDSGTSWTQVNDGLTNGEVFSLTVGSGNIFAGTGDGVFRRPLSEIVPVELTSFTGIASGKEVILNWVTATELNNRGFEIQRKVVEGDFATVGFIKGEGTTTDQKEYSYVDKNLAEGNYLYRLKQIDFSGKYEYSNTIAVDVRSLDNFTLEQNYPNPFNPTTTIGYVLQEKASTKLTLMNAIGEEVAILVNEEQDKGYHKVDFNANNLPSGVYLYKLQVGNFIETKKLMLLK